jgi:hypothetical protein
MLLFRDSVASIVKWMHNYNRTDAELAYWLKKYLIFQGTRSLTALIMAGGGGLSQLMRAVASQDLIRWAKFLHSKTQSISRLFSTFIAHSNHAESPAPIE